MDSDVHLVQRCYCGHKAHKKWSWAPGHFDGYKCDCCIRKIWEETLRNVTESLKDLPFRCE